MAATLLEIYTLYSAKPPTVTQRIQSALSVWGDSVFVEAADAADHANRVELAGLLLDQTNREKVAQLLMPMVVLNATYQAQQDDITDTDLQYIVNLYLGKAAVTAAILAAL